jgi:hypothetical protein
MSYTATPAFYSPSDAYHGGDPVWIRPANRQFRRVTSPAGANLGDDFSWAAEIPSLIQTVGTIGTTAVQLREQQIQNKRQNDAAANATAAQNAQTAALEQATAANAAVADPTSSPAAVAAGVAPVPGRKGGGKSSMTLPLIIGGSVIGLALVVALIRRRG